MACKLAENQPLTSLRKELDVAPQCHSLREHCIQSRERQFGEYTMGIPGAVIGYCQALFNRAGGPQTHTEYVTKLLREISAPWARSHELFWGNRRNETPTDFMQSGMQPLLGTGRVPILISELDPALHSTTIESIVATNPPVFPGETMLIRVVLSSDESIDSSITLVSKAPI